MTTRKTKACEGGTRSTFAPAERSPSSAAHLVVDVSVVLEKGAVVDGLERLKRKTVDARHALLGLNITSSSAPPLPLQPRDFRLTEPCCLAIHCACAINGAIADMLAPLSLLLVTTSIPALERRRAIGNAEGESSSTASPKGEL